MQVSPPWRAPAGVLGALVAAAHARAAALAGRARDFERLVAAAPPAPGFADALRGHTIAVIAEVKRRSPSKGDINPGLAAGHQAAAYAAGGAAALSILTEPARFGGSDDDLRTARASVRIPLLKKDFHVASVQVLEAAALGASALLLIARAVRPAELAALAALARDVGLESLVEVRDERELDVALAADAAVIGVNNRDLETLAIDLATADRLVPLIPGDRVAVAESGVRGPAEVERAARAGADAVLVGSSVSAAADPGAAVRALTSVPRVGRAGAARRASPVGA